MLNVIVLIVDLKLFWEIHIHALMLWVRREDLCHFSMTQRLKIYLLDSKYCSKHWLLWVEFWIYNLEHGHGCEENTLLTLQGVCTDTTLVHEEKNMTENILKQENIWKKGAENVRLWRNFFKLFSHFCCALRRCDISPAPVQNPP